MNNIKINHKYFDEYVCPKCGSMGVYCKDKDLTELIKELSNSSKFVKTLFLDDIYTTDFYDNVVCNFGSPIYNSELNLTVQKFIGNEEKWDMCGGGTWRKNDRVNHDKYSKAMVEGLVNIKEGYIQVIDEVDYYIHQINHKKTRIDGYSKFELTPFGSKIKLGDTCDVCESKIKVLKEGIAPVESLLEEDRIIANEEVDNLIDKKRNESSFPEINNDEISEKEMIKHLIDVYFSIQYFSEMYKTLYVEKRAAERFYTKSNIVNNKAKVESLKKKITDVDREISAVNDSIPIKNIPVIEDIKKLVGRKEPIKPIVPEIVPDFCETRPHEPVYEIPKFFNKRRVEQNNAKLRANYNRSVDVYNDNLKMYELAKEEYLRKYDEYLLNLKEYEKVIDEYNQELEKTRTVVEKETRDYNVQVKQSREKKLNQLREKRTALETELKDINNLSFNENDGLLSFYDKNLSEIRDAICSFVECQEQLYATHIVNPKYCEIAALTSMYEYLDVERCSRLKGPDGAYNMYENEIRANTIISRLDTVIDSLEQIKNNQFLLYQKLNSIDKQLSRMRMTISNCTNEICETIEKSSLKVEAKLKNIEKSTSVTAFYAEKNNRLLEEQNKLTETLCWLTAFS